MNGLGTKLAGIAAKETKEAAVIGRLFNMRDTVHLAHLKVSGMGSYAQHTALGDLYDKLLDHTDEIAELTQSYVGILNIKIPPVSYMEMLPFLKTSRNQLIQDKASFNGMPDIQNELDALIGSISKTIYKLENLK